MIEWQSSGMPPGAGCPVCHCAGSAAVLERNGHTIARCSGCGTLHVSPMPSDEDLRAHYQQSSYFDGQEGQGYLSYAATRKALIPQFGRRLRVIDEHLPRRGRLLDFGCAAGYFLELARSDGWEIAGVELSDEMARTASGALQIPVAPSLENLPERHFDAVTLWEVIEHLPQPIVELSRLRDLLRPGGLLMLSTPNAGHWQAVREPGSWISYRPPSHLIYFTQHTLEHVLRRAGFERVAIRRTSPLPPLPLWLRRLSSPLERSLATGQARLWPIARLTWRAIRVFGLGWQAIAHRDDDAYATLEAVAFRPT